MTQQEVMELIRKAGIDTSTGGLMPAESVGKFIDLTVEQSEFLQAITIEKDITVTRNLDTLGVASRLMYKATESTDPATIRGVTVGQRVLTPVEAIMPYDISIRWLEENIAREAAEEQVNQAFAKQWRNDLVDLAFNGDTAAGAGADQNFLIICNGFKKRVTADGSAHLFNRAASTDWKGTIFPGLVKAMPSKYKGDPSKLRFFVSFDTEEEYRSQLADRATALGDAYLTERRRAQFKGIEVIPVPNVPYGHVELTDPKNLSLGFGREMSVYRFVNGRKRQIEYTITAKVDANYAISDAIAYCN